MDTRLGWSRGLLLRSSRVLDIDNDLIVLDSLSASAEGWVERQKLNQTAAPASVDWVFSVQADAPIEKFILHREELFRDADDFFFATQFLGSP